MQFKYLPRVKYKNVIVHRATWQFKKDDVKELISTKKQDLRASVKALQKKWSIPDLVYLIEGDNELLFNLNNDIFNKKIYTNECIVSFGKKILNPNTDSIPIINQPSQTTQRIFSPGSEWLYYKIYMGQQSTNEILLTQIQPLLHQLQQQNYIDKWFFIRYY